MTSNHLTKSTTTAADAKPIKLYSLNDPVEINKLNNSSGDEEENEQEASKSSKRLTRNQVVVLVLLLIYFMIVSCYFSLISPFFTKSAEDRNLGKFHIGVVFGIYQFFILILSPVFGKLVSK